MGSPLDIDIPHSLVTMDTKSTSHNLIIRESCTHQNMWVSKPLSNHMPANQNKVDTHVNRGI